MPVLLVVGGGLFGSQAAAYARSKGIELSSSMPVESAPLLSAAAGLFKEEWAGKKLREHYLRAVPVLDRLFGIRSVSLTHDDGRAEIFQFVPPSAILETNPLRATVTAVGDGWLEADGKRYTGWVYIAAGIWAGQFHDGLMVLGKAGASFLFADERPGRIRGIGPGRQAIAFARDAGRTFFSDGTAELDYTAGHDRQTLDHAAALGLTEPPIRVSGAADRMCRADRCFCG